MALSDADRRFMLGRMGRLSVCSLKAGFWLYVSKYSKGLKSGSPSALVSAKSACACSRKRLSEVAIGTGRRFDGGDLMERLPDEHREDRSLKLCLLNKN